MSRKVMVVDDVSLNVRMLEDILKNDYIVLTAQSGEEALGYLKKITPDLILLDNTMKGMSGFDVLRVMRKDSVLKSIPVILLSSNEDDSVEIDSLEEGAVDFIYNSGDIYVENTTLLITRKSGGFIVAPSHAEDVKWGYVFRDCTITAPGDPSQTSVWLGRPWHNSPKTVFLNTRAEVTIPATGWYETMGGLPVIWAECPSPS